MMNDQHLEGLQLGLDYADIAEALTTFLFSHALILIYQIFNSTTVPDEAKQHTCVRDSQLP